MREIVKKNRPITIREVTVGVGMSVRKKMRKTCAELWNTIKPQLTRLCLFLIFLSIGLNLIQPHLLFPKLKGRMGRRSFADIERIAERSKKRTSEHKCIICEDDYVQEAKMNE